MNRVALAIGLAVLLISPWPVIAIHYRPQPNTNLVAIPALGRTLQAPVSAVFSRGRFFQIVDLARGSVTVIDNPFRREKHAAGLRSAHLLLEQRVGVVIAQHIGPEPFAILSARGVDIFVGTPPTVLEAVAQYRGGRLSRPRRPNVPIHYGLEQQGVAAPPPAACPFTPTAP